MAKLHIARNLIDFGIVIVVWFAQVIMYPSLAHIEREAFVSWHRKYSSRIALFVIPLLCGQAIIVLCWCPHSVFPSHATQSCSAPVRTSR